MILITQNKLHFVLLSCLLFLPVMQLKMFHIFDFKMKWVYCTLTGLYKSRQCEGSCSNTNQYIYINSTFWFGGGHFAVWIISFLMQQSLLSVQWWIHCSNHLFELFSSFALTSTEITTPIRLLFPDILPSKLGSGCFFPHIKQYHSFVSVAKSTSTLRFVLLFSSFLTYSQNLLQTQK